MAGDVYVHAQAINESCNVGKGTTIWAFAHVLEGAIIGQNCVVGGHAFIEGGAVVGNGVTIKNGVAVWNGVKLDDYVFVGPYAVFTNDAYPRSPRNPIVASRYQTKQWLVRTHICEGVSIGANATIVCGITIGRYALIAAGATVTKNVPPHALVVGVPGRVVGYVCVCGAKLDPGRFQCSSCERVYRSAGKGLQLINKKFRRAFVGRPPSRR